ncbi:MAG: SPOR domain-containing protein, partial [Rikenellaceae bacterium]|nr:SPOR domain-containing protein [Rikenellaceae bacterium]
GEINGKAFTPSPELDKVLNPVGGRAIQLTPRVQSKQIAIIAGVVAVVIVGLFIYFHRSPEERRHAYQEQMARDLERRNLERAQKGMEMVTADQAPPGLDGTDAADAQPATQTASTPAATAAGPLYHVVFGVFSTPENADKFIREFKAKDTQTAVSFTVVKMGNGKLVVSGFASADEKQADAKRKQYAAQYPGLWIYKQKK